MTAKMVLLIGKVAHEPLQICGTRCYMWWISLHLSGRMQIVRYLHPPIINASVLAMCVVLEATFHLPSTDQMQHLIGMR